MRMLSAAKPLYIFIDEGGNLDFSPKGSKYFTLTSVAVVRPFPFDPHLGELRFDLLEGGLELEYFHATEDRQSTRDSVFNVLSGCIGNVRVDSIVVEKRKTGPSLQADVAFYPRMMGYLLQYVFTGLPASAFSEVIVITDQIPINKKRNLVEKAVKMMLANMLPKHIPYRIIHHDSKSCSGLQVVDYVNWAIFRKWERGDARSHVLVQSIIRTEFDIFKAGTMIWY